MLTTVPPARGPAAGETAVMLGARVKVLLAMADGPPLFEMVWPVNT